MTTNTDTTTSPLAAPAFSAARGAWQSTFAAGMGLALAGLVALAFGSIAETGPAITAHDCNAQNPGTFDRC